MIIHSYIIAFNEEKILPWVLNYHSRFFDQIFVYDNMSYDTSDVIYKKYPKVIVIKFDSQNKFNNRIITKIKNNAYQQSRGIADWVVVSDCDELLYHENLLDKLQEYMEQQVTLPLIDGRGLVSETTPIYDGTKLLTDVAKIGTNYTIPNYCKSIVFHPSLNIRYTLGAHTHGCKYARISNERELKLLHYRIYNKEYITNRFKLLFTRTIQEDFKRGIGTSRLDAEPTIVGIESVIKDNYKLIP
jgi:hypothetical protein